MGDTGIVVSVSNSSTIDTDFEAPLSLTFEILYLAVGASFLSIVLGLLIHRCIRKRKSRFDTMDGENLFDFCRSQRGKRAQLLDIEVDELDLNRSEAPGKQIFSPYLSNDTQKELAWEIMSSASTGTWTRTGSQSVKSLPLRRRSIESTLSRDTLHSSNLLSIASEPINTGGEYQRRRRRHSDDYIKRVDEFHRHPDPAKVLARLQRDMIQQEKRKYRSKRGQKVSYSKSIREKQIKQQKKPKESKRPKRHSKHDHNFPGHERNKRTFGPLKHKRAMSHGIHSKHIPRSQMKPVQKVKKESTTHRRIISAPVSLTKPPRSRTQKLSRLSTTRSNATESQKKHHRTQSHHILANPQHHTPVKHSYSYDKLRDSFSIHNKKISKSKSSQRHRRAQTMEFAADLLYSFRPGSTSAGKLSVGGTSVPEDYDMEGIVNHTMKRGYGEIGISSLPTVQEFRSYSPATTPTTHTSTSRSHSRDFTPGEVSPSRRRFHPSNRRVNQNLLKV